MIGLTLLIDFTISTQNYPQHTKLLTMYFNICVIVNQPINIEDQERQCMMFSTIVQAKYLNDL